MAGPSVNLLELLRPSQVVVAVGGTRFTLEAVCATDWLGALAMDMDGLYGIMPGLIADDDLEAMEQIMANHPDIDDRWTYAARTALGRAGGRDWWWTLSLCRKALGTWMYTNGVLLRQNVDAKKLSFPDWIDACYSLYWQNSSEEDRLKLDLELNVRPRGVALKLTKAQLRQQAAAFAAD